jgi:AAA+ superfamily predicted ATPase/DNA-binding FadR family transcriptional regulator
MLEKIFGKKDDLKSTLTQLKNVIERLAVVKDDCNNAIESGDDNQAEEYFSKIPPLYDECNELSLKYLEFLLQEENPQQGLEEAEYLIEVIQSAETFFDTFRINIEDIKAQNFINLEMYRGIFLLHLQKYRRALKSFDAILAIDASRDNIWTLKGMTLQDMGNNDGAMEAFETAIDLEWHNAIAWKSKGQILQSYERYPEALEAFETALEIDDTDEEAITGRKEVLDFISHEGESEDRPPKAVRKHLHSENGEESPEIPDSEIDDEPNRTSPSKTGKKVFQKPAEKKKEAGLKGFASVAGMLELKALLTKDVIKPLKNPDKYKKFNVTIPNGILLFGPPGCGKTFIVEKLAEEVGYNFQVVPPSRIGSKYIHETSDNIAKIFTEAKNLAPTILFFDEFEALVPKRESLGSEGQFKNEEINEFLTHLNNASKMGILVVGATNQPDLIDSAVMRAGRMDKIILVPPPDFEARKELFSSRLSKVPHSSDMDFGKLAEKTEYYSSSDIAAIIEAAGRIAGDQDLDEINEDLMEHVIENSKPSISKSQIESFNAFSHLERK